MIFSGTRLPEEIRIALEEDRLVVFAGAGISFPPPSNLPLFNRLASQIGGGAQVPQGREDRFLGQLANSGTDVHTAAAQILYNSATAPTQLHTEILRLFATHDKVRLVTTNFDDHFTAAGRKIFGSKLREFYAPALPLGDDFAGLVYLHGSARHDPLKLVLTDKDFGLAYLTRGWARDFLVALFSRYTVLFVGYSHSDVTTTYLARGLNQADIKPRWSLVPANLDIAGRENWAHLEISLIEYSVAPNNPENPHQPLTEFIGGWARQKKEHILTKAKRIKQIARGLPPESEGVSEYLRYCLAHPNLAREFCDAVRHPAWVGWMADHGYFRDCFIDSTVEAVSSPTAHFVVAQWLCNYVRKRFPELLIGLIHQHNRRLSGSFCQILASALWTDRKEKPSANFPIWVSLLLERGLGIVGREYWAYLLAECDIPAHNGVAYRLFDIVTMPELSIRKGWDWSSAERDSHPADHKFEYSVGWQNDSKYWVEKAWNEIFKANLALSADPLSQVIVKQFVYAHEMLKGIGNANDKYDVLTWMRSSIGPHEQNDLSSDDLFSLQVDILAEILRYWIRVDPARARAQAELWWATSTPLLKRFTAYARSIDPQYLPDECINWIVNEDIIFRTVLKKEVFDVLAATYARASEFAKRSLIRRVEKGSNEREDRKLDTRTHAYEKFNVLVWLRRADTSCRLVQKAISKIQRKYPEFGERDHPQFNYWHGSGRAPDRQEELNVDQVLNNPPNEFFKDLRSSGTQWNPFRGRDRLDKLPELFGRDISWGRRCLEYLATESPVDGQAWDSSLEAYHSVMASIDDWDWILTAFEHLPRELSLQKGAAYFLSHHLWNSEGPILDSVLDRSAGVIGNVWTVCKTEKEVAADTYRNWLTSAINHVGGWISEFWVKYCDCLFNQHGAQWIGVPAPIRASIVEAVNGKDRLSVCARIALTPSIGYFFTWDQPFAVEHLLPLFDWDRDPVVAQQSWSVFLGYGQSGPKQLAIQLKRYYQQFASRASEMQSSVADKTGQFDQETLRRLGYSMAGIAMEVETDPVASGFFRDFLPLLPNEIRTALASGIGNHLRNYDDSERESVWMLWLHRYLDQRLIGIPAALSTSEANRMLEWCLYLQPVFQDAVDCIIKMHRDRVFAHGLVEDLKESPVLKRYPLHSCRLVNAALQVDDMPHVSQSLLALRDVFKNAIPRTSELRVFEELLYARGWRPS